MVRAANLQKLSPLARSTFQFWEELMPNFQFIRGPPDHCLIILIPHHHADLFYRWGKQTDKRGKLYFPEFWRGNTRQSLETKRAQFFYPSHALQQIFTIYYFH